MFHSLSYPKIYIHSHACSSHILLWFSLAWEIWATKFVIFTIVVFKLRLVRFLVSFVISIQLIAALLALFVVVCAWRFILDHRAILWRLRCEDLVTMREVTLGLLIVYLLLDLIIRSVPILLTHLVRIGQLPQDVYIVITFGSSFVRCFLYLIGCQVDVEKCAFEVKYSIFWLTIRYGHIVTSFF